MKYLPKFIFLPFTLVLFFIVLASPRTVEAAEPAGMGQATVSWNSVSEAKSYNLYFKEAGEKSYTHSAPNLPNDARSFTINYLKPRITYWYTVAAVSDSGKEYAWSKAQKFWAGASPMTNPPSTQAIASKPAGYTATARWNRQTRAEYYNVYYREAGQKGYQYAVPQIPAAGTSITIGALRKGVGYYYNVAAFYDGKEHWLGEKVLVWPVEVVYLNQGYTPLAPTPRASQFENNPLPPPVTPPAKAPSAVRDPFATDSLDVLPPPVTSGPRY